ncbi:MBL fold metallo-hydrolase [Metabacillus sp. GX 13764]|uniref:MBL fold metallo-hydrolase n=1 Tax=Metabacillus kandeliae TaxID=2900151 RepID=UPI001E4FCA38|nr:MBL fold metallo-hydrolase [Metabacillus kandeliae]MCD7036050.1 MBL fold metallo-hydrolase [Metabacillus kandeliae]
MIQFQNDFVTVFQSALYQTTSTVIKTSDLVLVADPCWLPSEIKEIQDHVKDIQDDLPVYLLFTHGDFDHIIGCKAFPGAKIIGSRGFADHPEKQKKLEMIISFDQNHYIRRDYPIVFPEADIIAEKDGQTLTEGSTTLHFYLAPGHSKDGLITVVEPMGIWIAGDYLSDFELPFIYDSTQSYIETIAKARKLMDVHHMNLLIPGHGHPTSLMEEAETRIKMAEEYLEALVQAVAQEDERLLEVLENRMAFPSSFTKHCHETNVEITKKEVKKGIFA